MLTRTEVAPSLAWGMMLNPVRAGLLVRRMCVQSNVCMMLLDPSFAVPARAKVSSRLKSHANWGSASKRSALGNAVALGPAAKLCARWQNCWD